MPEHGSIGSRRIAGNSRKDQQSSKDSNASTGTHGEIPHSAGTALTYAPTTADTLAGGSAARAEETDCAPSDNGMPEDGQTAESKTSAAGKLGSAAQGAADALKDYVDRNGRAAAGKTLTQGNAGTLPAKGFANRADLAKALTNPLSNAADALKATPYGPNALSTQQLGRAATTAGRFGTAGGVAGIAAGPLIGAYEGYKNNPGHATTGEKIAHVFASAAKELDDSAVSFGAGAAAATLTLTAAAASGPAAPAIATATPVTSTTAAIGASAIYDNTALDKAYDNLIEHHAEPALATVIDRAINAYRTIKSWF